MFIVSSTIFLSKIESSDTTSVASQGYYISLLLLPIIYRKSETLFGWQQIYTCAILSLVSHFQSKLLPPSLIVINANGWVSCYNLAQVAVGYVSKSSNLYKFILEDLHLISKFDSLRNYSISSLFSNIMNKFWSVSFIF